VEPSQLRFLEFQCNYLNCYNDEPAGLPEEWSFGITIQNTADAQYFGSPVVFRDG